MRQRYEVLVVCLGNICRSPVAERLLRMRLASLLGGSDVEVAVSSAGMRAVLGSRMDQTAATELHRLGGDGHDFLSRPVTGPMVDGADLVLTASLRLRSQVLAEAPRALRRTFTIREFAALVGSSTVRDVAPRTLPELVATAMRARGVTDVTDLDVPDPIGRSAAVHRDVADLLDADCATIADALARAASADSAAPRVT